MASSSRHDARPTAAVPVTIHVPPPPSYPFDPSSGDRAQLLATMFPSERDTYSATPFEPVVGDVKMTLDDLKSSLLRYYARLYAVEGKSLDERLNYLQQYHYPSPYPISPHPSTAEPSSLRKTPLGLELDRGGIAPQRSTTGYDGSQTATPKRRPTEAFNPCRPEGEGDFVHRRFDARMDHKNFYGALMPTEHDKTMTGGDAAAAAASLPFRQAQHYLKETADEGAAAPPGIRSGIAEVLDDIKTSVDAASRRLAGVSDHMIVETEDPTLRGFQYRNVPRYRRRPYFGTQRDLEAHMLQLYEDLHSKAEFNQRKIRALRSQMTALQMASLAPMAKIKDDPRIGY